MSMNTSPVFPHLVHNAVLKLAVADTTVVTTLYSGDTDGSRIKSISASTDDGTAVNLRFWVTKGAVDYLLGTVNIPIGAGNTNTVVPVDCLNTTVFPWLKETYLMLASDETLKVSCVATVSNGKFVWIRVEGGDY